jgi:hypothetical protein
LKPTPRPQPLDRQSVAIVGVILLLSGWFLLLGLAIEHAEPELPYFVTEWMVTFSGGFVRRGILGQSFWSLGALLHISPLLLIQVVRIATAVSFLALLGFQCFKNQKALGLLGVVLIFANPLVCFYVWYNLGSLDLAFVLLTALNLSLSKFPPERYFPLAVLLFSTIGLFLVLSHEAFLFLCLPINLVISWRAFRRHRLLKLAAIYGLTLLGAVVAIRFHGTQLQRNMMIQDWAEAGVSLPRGNAIAYLAIRLPTEFRYVLSFVTPFRLFVWYLSAFLCVTPIALMGKALVDGASRREQERLFRLCRDFFATPIVCTLPLYYIGTDWNRWLALVFTNGVLCFLIAAPTRSRYVADPKLRACLATLILAGLFTTPSAIYFNVGASVGGPAQATQRLLTRAWRTL